MLCNIQKRKQQKCNSKIRNNKCDWSESVRALSKWSVMDATRGSWITLGGFSAESELLLGGNTHNSFNPDQG